MFWRIICLITNKLDNCLILIIVGFILIWRNTWLLYINVNNVGFYSSFISVLPFSLFFVLYSSIFLSTSTTTAIITSIEDAANAAVIEFSVPDIYNASISRGSVNVSPLVFDNAFTAPNSPSALDVQRIIPYIKDLLS